MKGLKYSSLRRCFNVDENVLATDQIDARKRRILHQVMHRKDTHVPDRFYDLVMAVKFYKIFLEALRRNVGYAIFIVNAQTGSFDGDFIQIGGEDLNRYREFFSL